MKYINFETYTTAQDEDDRPGTWESRNSPLSIATIRISRRVTWTKRAWEFLTKQFRSGQKSKTNPKPLPREIDILPYTGISPVAPIYL